MQLRITKERENPLLNRREVWFEVSYDGPTPRFDEVRKELIKALKAPENLLILDRIVSEFGRRVARGYAKVYGDEESLRVEPKFRLEKNLKGKAARKKKKG